MQSGFWGFTPLASALGASHLTRNASNVPTDATGTPTYRIYGPGSTVMQSGTGSLSGFQDSGTVTGATNASPVVYTSPGHGLTTGTLVTVSGVTGNTGANASGTVTAIDGNTFSLSGTTGTGAYVSGGTWHTVGLYGFSYTPTAGNGFVQGSTYTVFITSVVSAVTYTDSYTFTVV